MSNEEYAAVYNSILEKNRLKDRRYTEYTDILDLLYLEDVKKHNGEVFIDSESLRWMGYLYRYWTCWLGRICMRIIHAISRTSYC